jgi:DNA mismatch repair protein MLH1
VNWTEERACFESFLRELAFFYSLSLPTRTSSSQDEATALRDQEATDQKALIQHVVFPAAKLYLEPTKEMLKDGSFVKVTSLESLYKV